MSKRRAHPPEKPGYQVGYGRPPKHSRFSKGQSGNRQGRPRGRRNIATILAEVLHRKVVVTENGRTRKVPAVEAVLLRLLRKSLDGDPRAIDKLMKLLPMLDVAGAVEEKAEPDRAFDPAEDRELLEEFAAMIRGGDLALAEGS